MSDIIRLESYDTTPIYTIKTVVHETGIAPPTLRAWERRYGCLAPGRSKGGYRLYSERDIALLRWLKQQVDAGISISRAVALLEMHRKADDGLGQEAPSFVGMTPTGEGAQPGDVIVEELVRALLAFKEEVAEQLLSEAFALYSLDTVAEEIITPVLVEIGERWHRGEATIVQEHFATAFLRRRLTALFQAYEQPANGPLAVTGSAPAEWHDVGILLVSLALKRYGWRVVFLGQNVPAERFLDHIRNLRPDLICLSAAMSESARGLQAIYASVMAEPPPRPRLALGGRAFAFHPELATDFPAALIAATPRELIARLVARKP
ncbi:MAG: MerR family transcriptional regulator [Anaerolineae bacterium]